MNVAKRDVLFFVVTVFNQIIFFRIRLFFGGSDEEADQADVGDE